MTTDEFLGVDDVATLLHVSEKSVRRWIDGGLLPALQLPTGTVRIRRSALDRFMEDYKPKEKVVGEETKP